MMISETLLRQYIRELFLEASRVGMPAGELSKPKSKYGRPDRFKIMLEKIRSDDWFTISIRKEVTVDGLFFPEEFIKAIILKDDPHNQEIITLIQNLSLIPGKEQEEREEGARSLQQMVKEQGIKVQVMQGPGGPLEFIHALGQFTKTGKDDITPHQKLVFKSQGAGGKKALGIISEERVVEDINLAVQGLPPFETSLSPDHPLTVVLLDNEQKNTKSLKGVVSANAAGTEKKGGVTSKSDVDIKYDGGDSEISVSMKMINAGHWLSADTFFVMLSPYVQALRGSGIKVPGGGIARIVPSDESANEEMVVEKDGQLIPTNFTIPGEFLGSEFMQHAVFGSGVNRADIVLKGDYWYDEPVGEWDPSTKTLSIAGSIYTTLDDLPDRLIPRVIITGSTGRKKTYLSPQPDDEGNVDLSPTRTISGLRFQIVIGDRASTATSLALDQAVNKKDITVSDVMTSPTGQKDGFMIYRQLEESLLREFVREMILAGITR